jgi:hypothetical protein
MKIKQYAAAYLVIFFVLFSGDIKETFAGKAFYTYEIEFDYLKNVDSTN